MWPLEAAQRTPPTRTVLEVDTQPRTAHTYTLQFQLDEKRDDFPCPLRAANVPAQQFLLADKRAAAPWP